MPLFPSPAVATHVFLHNIQPPAQASDDRTPPLLLNACTIIHPRIASPSFFLRTLYCVHFGLDELQNASFDIPSKPNRCFCALILIPCHPYTPSPCCESPPFWTVRKIHNKGNAEAQAIIDVGPVVISYSSIEDPCPRSTLVGHATELSPMGCRLKGPAVASVN